MRSIIVTLATAAIAACARPGSSPPLDPATNPTAFTIEGPLKFDARPTSAAITPIDLMSRLYVFADDSMMGRDDGGPVDNAKGTNYIAAELRRLGVQRRSSGC